MKTFWCYASVLSHNEKYKNTKNMITDMNDNRYSLTVMNFYIIASNFGSIILVISLNIAYVEACWDPFHKRFSIEI